jgi:hypothetical protein
MEFVTHWLLGGKGGIGKSLVSALLAQYHIDYAGIPLGCIDTDPVNATFTGYKAFNTRHAKIMQDGNVDVGLFDGVLLAILGAETNHVVDNGASCFIPLTKYLLESEALSVLHAAGRKNIVHTVVTGGYGLLDTISGLDWLIEHLPSHTEICVWLNEYFGPIVSSGKSFEEMQIYERCRGRISALLHLPKLNEQTFGRDLKLMLDERLTFAQAKASPAFNVISKQRIAMMERQLLDQVSLVV